MPSKREQVLLSLFARLQTLESPTVRVYRNQDKPQKIEGGMIKLNASATKEYREQVDRLAAALYDLQAAEKAAKEAEENRNKAIEEINRGILRTKPSYEDAKTALDEWKAKLINDLGGATEANQHYLDQLDQIYSVKLKDIYYRSLLDSDKWEDGVARAFHRYADEATNAAWNAERVFSDAASSIEDTLVDMVSTGEFSLEKLGDLIQSIEQDMASSGWGIGKQFKPVTIGSTLGATDAQDFTYNARALKPYSPAHITGSRNGGGDLTIDWKRRTRLNGDWRDAVDVPLSEESERYEVEIMDGSAVMHTITGLTGPTAVYSAAQQVVDFGAPQSSILVNVYQLSAAVGRGYAGIATL